MRVVRMMIMLIHMANCASQCNSLCSALSVQKEAGAPCVCGGGDLLCVPSLIGIMSNYSSSTNTL